MTEGISISIPFQRGCTHERLYQAICGSFGTLCPISMSIIFSEGSASREIHSSFAIGLAATDKDERLKAIDSFTTEHAECALQSIFILIQSGFVIID